MSKPWPDFKKISKQFKRQQRLVRRGKQRPLSLKSGLWLVGIVSALPLAVLILLIIKTDAPLSERPGLQKRIKRYLSENQAETSNTSAYPELHTPLYMESPEHLFELVSSAVQALGWTLSFKSQERLEIKAEISAPILRVKDDISIQITAGEQGLSALQIRSASRVGKADMGANIRHIIDLKQKIAKLRLRHPAALKENNDAPATASDPAEN